MSEAEKRRLVAWRHELEAAHDRLRAALRVSRESVADQPDSVTRDLLLYCMGFCTALDGHHRSEDAMLFPALSAVHPELRETIRYLEQDHSMIAYLIGELETAARSGAPPTELARHLEGIAAIMESHFRYEERQLSAVLESLELDAPVEDALGPL